MNFKKLFITISLMAGLLGEGISQQLPNYSLYYWNQFMYNPSRTGAFYNAPTAFVNYRKQWSDIPGAPEIKAFTIDAPLQDRMGVGAYVFSNTEGVMNRVSFNGSYAYHVPLAADHTLSLGLNLGYNDTRLDFGRTTASGGTTNDPALLKGAQSNSNVDGGFGLNYSWKKKLNVGFSVPQIFNSDIRYFNTDRNNPNLSGKDGKLTYIRHYFATASYHWDVHENWWIEPIVRMRAADGVEMQFDGTVYAAYKNLVWVGAGYRQDFSASFSAGVILDEQLRVGYVYDHGIGELKNSWGGLSHEFFVGFTFGKKAKEMEEKMQEQIEALDYINETIDTLKAQDSTMVQDIAKAKEENEALVKEMEQMRVDKEELQENLVKAGVIATDAQGKPTQAQPSIPTYAGAIFFDQFSAEIKPDFAKDLDVIAGIMKDNPKLLLMVRAHSDDIGTENKNMRMSEKRAVAVMAYLQAKGVSTSQIMLSSHGEAFPKVPNTSEENRAANRRVEFAILRGL